MPYGSRTSFRILNPEPFDFSRAVSFSPEIHCTVEFPTKLQAVRLEKILLNFSPARHIRVERKFYFNVFWVISWSKASILPRVLNDFPELSEQVEKGLKGYAWNDIWELRGKRNRCFRWDNKTQIMGILNITPDSFSDGGRYFDPQVAAERAFQMEQEGADWIDIGGESTRPGAKAVSTSEEKKRILPVVKACAKVLRIPISVDTYKSEVAEASIAEGAQMVNEIGALRLDKRMAKTLARLKVPVVLMHMRGKPRTMQKNPVYWDVVGEILTFFRERIDFAQRNGVQEDRLLIDPGFGFGKTPWHNMELTRRLWEFKVLGRPIVIGPSRKSSLGILLGGAPPEEREEATAAAITASILKGADFVRVHDVKRMARVVRIADALRYDRGLALP
jgi:dihydropteroate synthase